MRIASYRSLYFLSERSDFIEALAAGVAVRDPVHTGLGPQMSTLSDRLRGWVEEGQKMAAPVLLAVEQRLQQWQRGDGDAKQLHNTLLLAVALLTLAVVRDAVCCASFSPIQ